jgi:hypothetical protein
MADIKVLVRAMELERPLDQRSKEFRWLTDHWPELQKQLLDVLWIELRLENQ